MKKVMWTILMFLMLILGVVTADQAEAAEKINGTEQPVKVKVYNTKRQTLRIKCSKVEGATKYRYYYATKKNGSYKHLKTAKQRIVTVKNDKLLQSKTYYVKVVATGKGVKQTAIGKIKMKKKWIGTGKTVAIDAGHQQYGNSSLEPNGPGSGVMKAKVTSGTRGCVTGLPEYKLNLQVALKLEKELKARGYKVVMIRRKHKVDMSNRQRAVIANQSGADILIRIHANGSANSTVSGTLTMSPSASNPYVSHLYKNSYKLSQSIVNAMCKQTKANNQGVMLTDTMSGINWCTIPVTIVEMGYMTNPAEDRRMASEVYQKKMAVGMANGIDQYFGRR